jgi:DNA-binding PadR family transcriptional regulator
MYEHDDAPREFDPQRFSRSLYELAVLGVLREGPRHGYEIGLEVAERTDGRFVLQHGTLYPVLHRLEKAGLIAGSWSGGEGERRRKEYLLTAAGRAHLAEEARWSRSILESFLKAVDGGGNESLRATS